MNESLVHFYTTEGEGKEMVRKSLCRGDVLEDPAQHIFIDLDAFYKTEEHTVTCVLCLRRWGNRVSSLAVEQKERVVRMEKLLRKFAGGTENSRAADEIAERAEKKEDSQYFGV